MLATRVWVQHPSPPCEHPLKLCSTRGSTGTEGGGGHDATLRQLAPLVHGGPLRRGRGTAANLRPAPSNPTSPAPGHRGDDTKASSSARCRARRPPLRMCAAAARCTQPPLVPYSLKRGTAKAVGGGGWRGQRTRAAGQRVPSPAPPPPCRHACGRAHKCASRRRGLGGSAGAVHATLRRVGQVASAARGRARGHARTLKCLPLRHRTPPLMQFVDDDLGWDSAAAAAGASSGGSSSGARGRHLLAAPASAPRGYRLGCWGFSESGQTKVPAGYTAGVKAVSAGGFHTCGIKAGTGALACWGANDYGQCNVPPGWRTGISAVSCGYLYTCALKRSGELKCWCVAGGQGARGGGGSISDAPPTHSLTTHTLPHHPHSPRHPTPRPTPPPPQGR